MRCTYPLKVANVQGILIASAAAHHATHAYVTIATPIVSTGWCTRAARSSGRESMCVSLSVSRRGVAVLLLALLVVFTLSLLAYDGNSGQTLGKFNVVFIVVFERLFIRTRVSKRSAKQNLATHHLALRGEPVVFSVDIKIVFWHA